MSSTVRAGGSVGSGERELSVLVVGASGFTGKYIVKRLLDVSTEDRLGLRVGAGGRSEARTRASLEAAGVSWDAVTFVPLDALEPASVSAAAARATLVVNCAGPFRRFGEPVVAACVAAGTHYIDISGEPEFIERMEAKYHAQAVANGALVVSACGFDSIPADLGTMFVMDQFRSLGATAASVESYLAVECPHPYCGHFTTWECAVLGFANVDQLKRLRRSRPRVAVPRRGPTLRQTSWPRREPRVGGRFALPFPGSDRSIVRRTMKHLVTDTPAGDTTPPPVQFAAYFLVASRLTLVVLFVAGAVMSLLTRFGWGRSLLLRYPRLFTAGTFSHAGPTQAAMETATFSLTLCGRGHTGTVEDGARTPTDCELIARVSGPDPGYLGTARMTTAAALTVLLDLHPSGVRTSRSGSGSASGGAGSRGADAPAAVPRRTGVLTTAAAFRGTRITDRLSEAGITLTVLSTHGFNARA